jgi:hypothetical protein
MSSSTRFSIRLGYLLALVLVLVFSLSLFAQEVKEPQQKAQKNGASRDLPPEAENSLLAQTARFFAAQPVQEGNTFFEQTKISTYPRFREEMQKYWDRFRGTTYDKIRAWQGREISDLEYPTVLYPFSGPDFLNVYAVYPDAETYIMIGLEKGGLIPVLETMPEASLRKGLNMMVEGFRIYIGYNFYRTLGMEVDLDQSPFTGILPHVLTQIAWLGFTPISVSSVSFPQGADGDMVTTPLERGAVTQSWQLECLSHEGKGIRIIYLSQDISNEGLRKSPGVKRWLEALPQVAGLFKAASYLPPRPAFSDITRICLNKMKSIIQDDSGIPYRMLRDRYDVAVYGWYTRPHGLFPSYGQPDLAQLYRNSVRRSLDFNFQYDRPDNARNLMVARIKIEK